MKKFMVMVNSKYMVTVEANSCYGAEHIILDNLYHGMRTALAFDEETMKTEHFVSCLMNCQTISFEELKSLSEECEEEAVKIGAAAANVIKAEAMLDAAKKALEEAEKALQDANEAHNRAVDLHNHQVMTGLLEKVRI